MWLHFSHGYVYIYIHFKRLMFASHKTIVTAYALQSNRYLLSVSPLCVSLSFFVCRLGKKAVIPVSLWAEVTHQMAGPEQRTCIGAKCCEEDRRNLHIAFQTHKAYWDIHCSYVIGVPLRRQQKQTVNWWRREDTDLYDQWHSKEMNSKEKTGENVSNQQNMHDVCTPTGKS